MKYKIILTVFLGFCGCVYAADAFNSGTWVSEKVDFRNGKEFIQLVLHKDKFILAKLSYNKERNWEETRIQGILATEDGEFRLKPEMCTVYATNKLGLRWILIQAFDCDHLEIQMTRNEQDILISPSFGISKNLRLKQETKNLQNEIPAIIVSQINEHYHIWSLPIRFLRKGATATYKGKPVILLETVDSTAKILIKETAEIGDKILLQNRVSSGLFD